MEQSRSRIVTPLSELRCASLGTRVSNGLIGALLYCLGYTRYSKIPIVSAHTYSPERRAIERKASQIKTILLVEDSDIERKVIRLAIESFTSFRVCEATNGIEGIKIAKEVKPDLIVLDLAMPQMSGLEAAYGLEKHDA
jgi:hypothetical protein